MEKRGKVGAKTGQFYLIAAIIIVIVIIGLSTVTNYVLTKDKPLKFYDLSSDLGEEGARVTDYGIYNAADIKGKIETFLTDFIKYSEEKEKDAEFVFIYGNEVEATAVRYTPEPTGTVSVTYGGVIYYISGSNTIVPTDISPTATGEDKDVEIALLNKKYDFKLKEGENFLFIISKKRGEETHVTTGSE